MVIPEPQSTAAGKRMLQLIEFFFQENFRISFLTAANNLDFSEDLEKLNVEFHKILVNDSSFEKTIQELNPDIVLFDRFVTEEQFGWKVVENCPNAIRILDTEDLHFLRIAREKSFKKKLDWTDDLLLNDVFKREIAAIVRCDLSLIISEFELQLLMNKFKIPENILVYFPLFAEISTKNKSFEERKDFISIGNFLHEPNWQTVLKLKEIWPTIKLKLPEAQLLIYGAYVTEKAKQLHNDKQGFLIKGRADSVEMVFDDAKVLLAPIPYGAGIKGKLLDAMQYGLPSVTTQIGAEGMCENSLWNGFVANDDKDFVEKTIQLYQQKNIWQNAQSIGFEIIKNKFSKISFYPKLSIKILEISKNINGHRNDNFWGQILLHHSLQSSKYMGKWIEEKNKKIGNSSD